MIVAQAKRNLEPNQDFMGVEWIDPTPYPKPARKLSALAGCDYAKPSEVNGDAFAFFCVPNDVWCFSIQGYSGLASKNGDLPVIFIGQSYVKDPRRPRNELLHFQNGLPAEVGFNGYGVEALLMACALYISYFQKSEMKCKENAHALMHLVSAIEFLYVRQARRRAQSIYGKMVEIKTDKGFGNFMPNGGFVWEAGKVDGSDSGLTIKCPWDNSDDESPLSVLHNKDEPDRMTIIQRKKTYAGIMQDMRNLQFHGGGERFTGVLFEAVLAACHLRLASYEELTPLGCEENRMALGHITAALNHISARRARRTKAGLQGKRKEQEGA